MIPQKLTLSGFLSYQQPVELDFSTFDIACISGSNGAGKSSLLDGITWVLFGKARHRDDNLLINSHCNTAEVTLDFQYEGSLYRIIRSKTRDKPVRLEFQVFDKSWKTLTESTLRETEASLIRTLRMDYDTFINASFFLQGKADQFSQQKPGDRKKILGNILGLEVWETYRESAADMRRQRENELAGVDRTIAEIDAELGEEGERTRRLKEIEESLAQAGALRKSKEKLVETIRKQFQAVQEQQRVTGLLGDQFRQAENRLKQVQSQLTTRLSEKNEYEQKIAAAPEIENAYHSWLTMRSDLEKWEKLAESFRQVDAKRQAPRIAIEKERSRLEQEAATLKQRQTQVIELQKQLPSIQAALDKLEHEIQAVKERISSKGSLEENIRRLQDERAGLAAENKNLNSEMKVLKERLDRLRQPTARSARCAGRSLPLCTARNCWNPSRLRAIRRAEQFRQNLEAARQIDESVSQVESELRAIQQLDLQAQQKTRQLDQGSTQRKMLETQLQHWSDVEEVRFQEVRRLLDEETLCPGCPPGIGADRPIPGQAGVQPRRPRKSPPGGAGRACQPGKIPRP